MAEGTSLSKPNLPNSTSSPSQVDIFPYLKFGTYNPNSKSPDAISSKDRKFPLKSDHPTSDPLLKATTVKQAPTSDSLLARKFLGRRSGEIQLKEGLPVVAFDIGIKEQLITKVKFVIVAKFSHGRPTFRDFQSFLAGQKFQGQFVISAFDHKHVFIDFAVFEDFVRLWMLKSCVVKGFKGRLFRWTDSFSPSVEISVAPVWISLPGLPLYFLEEETLFSIASAVGTPLYIDPLNLNRRKVGAAWICIALDVSKALPEAIWIHFMGEGKVIERFLQKIVYYDIPPYCTACNHLGHNIGECKAISEGRSNKGFEMGGQIEQGATNKQITEAVLMHSRKGPINDKIVEEGEIVEVTVGKESHLNEAKNSREAGVSTMESYPANVTGYKKGNSDIKGDVKHGLVADANPFEPLHEIKNGTDFPNGMGKTEWGKEKFHETSIKAPISDPMVTLNHKLCPKAAFPEAMSQDPKAVQIGRDMIEEANFKAQQMETLRKAPKDLSTGQTSTALACFAGSPGDREDINTPNFSLNRGQEQSQEEHVIEAKALDSTASPDAKATLLISAAAQAFYTALSTYSGQDLLDSNVLAKDCATGVDVDSSDNQQRSLDLQNGTDLQGLAQFNGMLVHQVNNRPKIVITDPKTKKIIELGRPLPNTSACHAFSSSDSSCTQDVSQTHCSFSETQKYLGELSATAASTCKEDIKESGPLKSTKKPKQSKKKAKKNGKKKPKKDLTEDEEDYSCPEYWKKLQEYREANPFPDYSEDYKDVRECARWMNSIDGDFFLHDNSDGEGEVNSFLPRFQSRPSRKCPSLDYLDLNYLKSPTA